MCDGVEVEVWMHGRQSCLVACVRTEPATEKGVQTRQTQPDVAPEYRIISYYPVFRQAVICMAPI